MDIDGPFFNSFFGGYALEISFSIAVISLLLSVIIYYRIQYGRQTLNKMSLTPYQLSMSFFTFQIINVSVYLYIYNLHEEIDDDSPNWQEVYVRDTKWQSITELILILKYLIFCLFICENTFQRKMLTLFVLY